MTDQTQQDGEVRFEGLLEELEQIVAALERGELPLEEALDRFEVGMALARKAGAILEGAEMRIEKLIEERDGTAREVPLQDG